MARHISKDTITQVEKQTDIVSLVGEYVALEERGRDYWGCCPFHKEDTPSFHVEPDTGFYYCFGCHAAGKAIKFVQEMEKVSYIDAVLILAKRAGVTVVYDTSYGDDAYNKEEEDAKEKKKQSYIDLYERVANSFHYLLTKGKEGRSALSYAFDRGLKVETIEKFRLGYAPRDMYWLRRFLKGKNFSDDFLNESGLFSKKHKSIAFFSNRLMFPIFDRFGKVVAFGGRDLSGSNPTKELSSGAVGGEGGSSDFSGGSSGYVAPKYLNSGDLIQYKKGETLFAFNFAKDSIRENKRVVFCEGYMDCIAYHQCGVNYAVAPLGTALTDEQIRMVKPFVKEVLLGFDNDAAGVKATKRAILMIRKADIPAKVIQITGGKDPAEIMVKSGENAQNILTKIVENAIIDSKFLLGVLEGQYDKSTAIGKRSIAEEYFPYISSIQSTIERDATLAQFSDWIGLTIASVKADYEKFVTSIKDNNTQFSKKQDNNKNIEENNIEELAEDWGDDGWEGEELSSAIDSRAIGGESQWSTFIDDRDIIGKLRDELRSVIIFIKALANSENKHAYDHVLKDLSEEDFKDESARMLFCVLKECYQKGEMSLLQIRDACPDKYLGDLVMMRVVVGEYGYNESEAVEGSVRWLRKKSLERKRDDLQKRMVTFSNLTPDDNVAKNKLLNEIVALDAQIKALGDIHGAK